jgi:hypothetical protein
MLPPTRRPIQEEEDPLAFLGALDHAYGRFEYWNRLPLYAGFLSRLVAVESAGARDGLVRAASRVFRVGVRAIKADLCALDEIHALERVHALPPRPPRSTT